MGNCNVLHITPGWQVQWKITRIRRGGGSNHIRWARFAPNVLHVVQGSQKPSIFAVQSSPHGGRDSIQTRLAPLGLQPPGRSGVSWGVSRCQWPGLRALPSHCFPGSTQWWAQPQETSTRLVNQAASMLGAHPACASFPNTDTPVLRLSLDRALPSIPTLALVTGISYPQALGIGYLVMRQDVGTRPCSVSCDASPHPPSR